MKCLIGFLIDTFEVSDKFRREMSHFGLPYFQDVRANNVIYIREIDRQKVIDLARLLSIEWKWTNNLSDE